MLVKSKLELESSHKNWKHVQVLKVKALIFVGKSTSRLIF